MQLDQITAGRAMSSMADAINTRGEDTARSRHWAAMAELAATSDWLTIVETLLCAQALENALHRYRGTIYSVEMAQLEAIFGSERDARFAAALNSLARVPGRNLWTNSTEANLTYGRVIQIDARCLVDVLEIFADEAISEAEAHSTPKAKCIPARRGDHLSLVKAA